MIMRRKNNSGVVSLINNHMDMDFRKYGKALPLGYRSNNPLNIRYYAGNNWVGKELPPVETIYGKYEQFRDLAYGYRAALVLLRGRSYISGGNNTIRKIISAWAPAKDNNNTESYITNVSRITGIDPDKVIKRNDKDSLTKIVYAMSISENGYKHKYKDDNGDVVTVDLKETYGLPNMEIINEGWRLL